jgi:hypothetical protein
MVLCGPGGSIKLPAVLRGHDSHRALAAERVVDEREQTTIKSGVRDSLYAWLHKISAKHRRHEPHVGARAGSRTLNLGIKRRLTFVARKRQDGSWRDSRTRWSDAFVPQSVLACHRLPWVSCQISCQSRVPRLPTSTRAHRTIVPRNTVRLLWGTPRQTSSHS